MKKVEICAPAGNFKSLAAAVENGADAVYMSLGGDTNLRNFPGLNFTESELEDGLKLAHKHKVKIFIAVNSFPQGKELRACCNAIDKAIDVGADAIIVSDFALLKYASENYPDINIHVSVQAHLSNYESIEYYKNRFNITRVVLPRILSLKEIRQLRKQTSVELEVFGVGLLCVNCEGLCYLSSFITGESINTYGACSPPKFVKFDFEDEKLTVKSNNVVLAEYAEEEKSAYPTPCKGLYVHGDKASHVFQNSESLNVIDILPEMLSSGVNAVKLEGRQRSSAYVAKVTAAFRNAFDKYYNNTNSGSPDSSIGSLFEGMQPTYGCYKKKED